MTARRQRRAHILIQKVDQLTLDVLRDVALRISCPARAAELRPGYPLHVRAPARGVAHAHRRRALVDVPALLAVLIELRRFADRQARGRYRCAVRVRHPMPVGDGSCGAPPPRPKVAHSSKAGMPAIRCGGNRCCRECSERACGLCVIGARACCGQLCRGARCYAAERGKHNERRRTVTATVEKDGGSDSDAGGGGCTTLGSVSSIFNQP